MKDANGSPPETHLVIGATGVVGWALMQAITDAGHDAIGTVTREPAPGNIVLDIHSAEDIERVVRTTQPDVIHLAAATGDAELWDAPHAVTVEVSVSDVQKVAQRAAAHDAHLVFYSSDHVFDGNNGPYAETDPVAPMSVHGELKAQAERIVFAHEGLIIRTAGVFGWDPHGRNVVTRLLHQLADGVEVIAPVDQIGTPTYAPNLAAASVEAALRRRLGILHVAGTSLIDRYSFSCAAASAFGLDARRIVPVDTRELGRRAARPLNAGLRTERARRLLETSLLGHREGLSLMVASRDRTTA